MQPNNQASQPSQQMPSVPQITQPGVQPTAVTPSPLGDKAHKSVRRLATASLWLGLLGIVIALPLPFLLAGSLFGSVPFSGVIVWSGIQLRKTKEVRGYLHYIRLLTVLVAIEVIVSLLAVSHASVSAALLLYFAAVATTDLKKANLISSASLFTAKP